MMVEQPERCRLSFSGDCCIYISFSIMFSGDCPRFNVWYYFSSVFMQSSNNSDLIVAGGSSSNNSVGFGFIENQVTGLLLLLSCGWCIIRSYCSFFNSSIFFFSADSLCVMCCYETNMPPLSIIICSISRSGFRVLPFYKAFSSLIY